MIRYVKRKDLNIEKYDKCIEESLQSRVYAYSWYLDIVADNWGVLALNDYEAVMPLPWKKKYFLKYISQPFFCQQLGVFSRFDLTEELLGDFIKKIPFYFVKVFYQFNSENSFRNDKNTIRKNYLLDLNDNYEDIRLKYRKDRKYRINQARKKGLSLGEISTNDFKNLTKKYYAFLNLKDKDVFKLSRLITTFIKEEKGFSIGVFKEEKLLGGCFFVKSGRRLIYLYSVMSSLGKENQAASLVIDEIIKKFANTEVVLDFEGSMIEGIASFYRSFGAVKEEYFCMKKSMFPF